MNKLLLLTMLLVSLAGFSFGQAKSGPAETSKSFYKWYLHELKADRTPSKTKMRTFISARLARWMGSKAYREYDADYFLDAQDFGKDWENNIQVSDVAVKGNSASLKVTLADREMGNWVLNVKLLREGGLWKIDRVKGKD